MLIVNTIGAMVTSKTPFTLRLEDDLKKRAERMALAEKRTLTSLMTYALAREVDAFESERAGRRRGAITSDRPHREA
jgi:predicted transcriptional regulator